jgi:hypothetical protein
VQVEILVCKRAKKSKQKQYEDEVGSWMGYLQMGYLQMGSVQLQ